MLISKIKKYEDIYNQINYSITARSFLEEAFRNCVFKKQNLSKITQNLIDYFNKKNNNSFHAIS